MRILITGSSGLIGHHLATKLRGMGHEIVEFDIKNKSANGGTQDVRNHDLLKNLASHCDGVIHLAAVSRVVWGQRDPKLCREINVGGTKNLYKAIIENENKPFVLFGSSREVYGNPDKLPVAENHEHNPCNIYGHTKVEGELLTQELGRLGLNACVFRFSNVYGWTGDHADRVIPAFARQAAANGQVRVDGANCVFDFTHVDDVVEGITRAVCLLQEGNRLPPIHLVSGKGTSLGELASLADACSQSGVAIKQSPPRDFDVGKFYGDYSRAREILGWHPSTTLEKGFAKLTEEYRSLLSC
ncbi:MAG: NAD(P)-dependent oxidoreductase [Hyphomicrobiales bacterium]|nr:NAD(P)-dependent oxidoreductase [Hyphomicrobiales bacterium]